MIQRALIHTFLILSLLCGARSVFAVTTEVTPIVPPTSGKWTITDYTNTKINPKLAVIESNRQDIETSKAAKTEVVRYWDSWPDASPGNTVAVNTIVAYEGKLYTCTQEFVKTAGATPVAFTSYFSEVTGSGAGIYHATSDGNYYASKDGAWSSLSGLYAPALGADDNYVTDAEKVVIGNTSGVNTGDQDISGKQDLLINQENIKSINGTPIIGSGNLTISGSLADGTATGQVPMWSGSAWVDQLLPAQYITATGWTPTTVQGVLDEINGWNTLDFGTEFVKTTVSGTTTVTITIASGTFTIPAATYSANSVTNITATNAAITTDHWLDVKLTGILSTRAGFGVTTAGSLSLVWSVANGSVILEVRNPTNADITTTADLVIPWRVRK